jgi:hypothetical protein
MPHDPGPDGCLGCDIWPPDRPGYAPASGPRPRGPGDDWRAKYRKGGALLAVRPCRTCSRPVRVADLGDGVRLHTEPEPLPATEVRPTWPAFWWSDTWGLTDREPLGDAQRTAAGELLFVMHPCDHTPNPPPTTPTKERSTVTVPTFGTPKAGGAGVDQHSIKNKLLLISVTEIVRGMVTKANKPGETTDAVRCDIVDLESGEEHSDALLFGKQLVNAFTGGVTYLGRLSKIDGKVDGRDHPWLFNGAQDDPAAVATATQYYTHKATQAFGQPAPAPVAPAPVAPAPAAPAASPFPAAAPAGAAPWAQ